MFVNCHSLNPTEERVKESEKTEQIPLLHQRQEHFRLQGQYFHLEEQQLSVSNYSI